MDILLDTSRLPRNQITTGYFELDSSWIHINTLNVGRAHLEALSTLDGSKCVGDLLLQSIVALNNTFIVKEKVAKVEPCTVYVRDSTDGQLQGSHIKLTIDYKKRLSAPRGLQDRERVEDWLQKMSGMVMSITKEQLQPETTCGGIPTSVRRLNREQALVFATTQVLGLLWSGGLERYLEAEARREEEVRPREDDTMAKETAREVDEPKSRDSAARTAHGGKGKGPQPGQHVLSSIT
jgi:hypothetical protein